MCVATPPLCLDSDRMGVSASKQLHNTLFELNWTSKSLIRASQKATKDEKAMKKKLKSAIEKGNHDGARIYAANVRVAAGHSRSSAQIPASMVLDHCKLLCCHLTCFRVSHCVALHSGQFSCRPSVRKTSRLPT